MDLKQQQNTSNRKNLNNVYKKLENRVDKQTNFEKNKNKNAKIQKVLKN